MRKLTIGFIGLGLIGGSIAKAIRRIYPDHTIIAYNRSEHSRIAALNDKVADIVTGDIDETFADCDYIFLCTPVEQNIRYLGLLKNIINPSCIITDVGSVKENIHISIESLGMSANFIGGHPMAGSEKTGYDNASAHLLENAFYAITPTSSVSAERVEELRDYVKSLGAIPVILDYKEHDYAVAAISHVPHLIAAALVNLIKDNDSQNGTMKLLAAGGFKDITRIASSSPEMWQQICSTNSTNINLLIDKYIEALSDIKEYVAEEGAPKIYDIFKKSRAYRNSFSDIKCGPIYQTYCIYCDIINKPGTLSQVVSIISDNQINLKNIGINYNRESDSGVMQIEFFKQNDMLQAKELLIENGYKIYMH